MRLLPTALLLALALPASAEIYRYLDARGNPVYTNQPPEGVASETIQLAPTNTVAAPSRSERREASAPAEAAPGRYEQIRLHGVEDGAALRSNAGDFSVSIELQPALHATHQLQLLLDGQPVAAPARQTHFAFSAMDRGEHRLQAVVLEDGQELQRSAVLTFTVQRVHIGSPALPRPQPQPQPQPKPQQAN